MGDVGDGDGDDEAAFVVGRGVGLGMHGVVVILGVGRIDGDERQLAPVLAVGKRGGLGGVRFLQGLAAEHVRDAVRVDGDQADRAFALERAEPLDHAAGGQAKPRRAAGLDRDQVAVLCVVGGAGRNGELLAEHLLVDRLEPSAAVRQRMENAEHARLGMIDDADDAAAVADAGVFFRLLDMQQHAVAEAGRLAGAGFARNVDADAGRGAVRFLVPLVGRGDEIAFAIARGDVGEHGRRQRARVMQLLAALFD